jgi:hypothetical protein
VDYKDAARASRLVDFTQINKQDPQRVREDIRVLIESFPVLTNFRIGPASLPVTEEALLAELPEYKHEAKEVPGDFDLVQFWALYGCKKLPFWSAVARTVFTANSNSAGSERVFSHVDNLRETQSNMSDLALEATVMKIYNRHADITFMSREDEEQARSGRQIVHEARDKLIRDAQARQAVWNDIKAVVGDRLPHALQQQPNAPPAAAGPHMVQQLLMPQMLQVQQQQYAQQHGPMQQPQHQYAHYQMPPPQNYPQQYYPQGRQQ